MTFVPYILNINHICEGQFPTFPKSVWSLERITLNAFFLVCCCCDGSYIVSVHIQCHASIYTLSLCRGHSWRVRLAKQETLTPPGHLVSPLVCRGPWMSTVVLYCWFHSDSASVLLYFTWIKFIYVHMIHRRRAEDLPLSPVVKTRELGPCPQSNTWTLMNTLQNVQEQDKSSDIKQQPSFGDRK